MPGYIISYRMEIISLIFPAPLQIATKSCRDGTFGSQISYKKFGGFSQVTKTLFDEKLKLWGSLRNDYNPVV